MRKLLALCILVLLTSCGGNDTAPNFFSITIDGVTTTYAGSLQSSPTAVYGGVFNTTVVDPAVGSIEAGTTIVGFADTFPSNGGTGFETGALYFEMLDPAPVTYTEADLDNFVDFLYLEGQFGANNIIFDEWYSDTLTVNITRHDDRIVGNFTSSMCNFDCNTFISVSGNFDVLATNFNTFVNAPR